MKEFNDQRFRKIFTGLVTLALLLIFVLSAHIFVGVPLNSSKLWSGSLIPFLAINLLTDINGIQRKLIVLSVSTVIMAIFFHAILNWPIAPSLYTGSIILVLSVLLYMTFIN